MSSYKPKVQILLNEEYHKKFKVLCDRERRSDSIMGALMIEKYINEYEAEHGEIPIEEKTTRAEAVEEFKEALEKREREEIGIKETMKKSFQTGMKFGKAEK